jgi:ubiquinone/menaquinone biosynthesis C-methylase UbiE
LRDVQRFWEEHPLCAYEIRAPAGSPEFFRAHDALKVEHSDRFNIHLYEFDGHAGEKVLDVGCGPGWLVQEYAKGRAEVVGMDLTHRAVMLARDRLSYQGLRGALLQANAERLPFRDASFDFVSASGVLHHTPDTDSALREIHRVLKPNGRAVVSLYHRSVVFHPLLWPLTRSILRRVFVDTGFREESRGGETMDDFVRLYDGDRNPLGKAYRLDEIRELFSSFRRVRYERHYFPRRFFARYLEIRNPAVLGVLDRILGTMVFAVAER